MFRYGQEKETAVGGFSLSLQTQRLELHFTLFLVQRSSSQGHIYGKNLQKVWMLIDDQTGRHELQRVLAMRYSLFNQARSLFH